MFLSRRGLEKGFKGATMSMNPAENKIERKELLMKFKVVNTMATTGIGYGEELLEPFDATLVAGQWFTEDDLINHTKDADAVICASPGQPWNQRVISTLSRCRILATMSIGYDRIHLETAGKIGLAVTNLPDFCIDEVSSQAIALIMALGRRLFPLDRAVREHQPHLAPANRKGLADYAYPIFRMRDQNLGIVGLGKIGTAVALKARGLGMRVIAYDPYVLGGIMLSRGVEPVGFDTLLHESDYISINADLNEETRGMFGQEEFRKMKTTCYLINTARGEIVQQAALLDALREGIIAGAGVDVTEDEPIAAENPILKMPNVIFTGHSAWYSTTSDSASELWHKPMTQVVMALKGEWPTYAVNPEIKKLWLEKWGRKA
jgi:D-3-phosphoglycerate dehydrogenase